MAFKFVKFHLSLWLQQNKLCICLNLLKYKSRALSFAEEALIEYVIYPIFKQIAIQVLENHIRGGGGLSHAYLAYLGMCPEFWKACLYNTCTLPNHIVEYQQCKDLSLCYLHCNLREHTLMGQLPLKCHGIIRKGF